MGALRIQKKQKNKNKLQLEKMKTMVNTHMRGRSFTHIQ